MRSGMAVFFVRDRHELSTDFAVRVLGRAEADVKFPALQLVNCVIAQGDFPLSHCGTDG